MAAFLERLLDEIEKRESALLVWGAVDGAFTAQEIADIVDPVLDAALEAGEEIGFYEARDALAEMVRRGWLVAVPQKDGTEEYRSRMAETVRLLARLRQLFPKHARTADGWQLAPTLVADFRFQRRPRRYPRRDISIAQVIEQLSETTLDQSLLRSAELILSTSASIREGGLAAFQVRSAERIVRAIENKKAWGTIVCAGTASGKTLAFYLPALASIIRYHLIEREGPRWVKAVAIYPRNELLKDQLREVFTRAIALPRVVEQTTRRPLRIGAFYGDVPTRAGPTMWWPPSWKSAGPHKVCPFLRCVRCNSDLLWREDDYREGRERLSCRMATCGFFTNPGELALTRESQAADPPDILFCTTETLNRQLSNSRTAHLFGVGPSAARSPELVLLDEVHTYEGRHGAQVAYLLRRWQHLVGHRLRFVGLSATLREASRFFADLIGNWLSSVAEISPTEGEMESEGAEYIVALRGDPVSRAALLSTSIQATMLIQRCLDERPSRAQQSVSQGLFGTRTFAFTDNLDVINRLYFNLLDAEGRNSFGAPDQVNAPNGGLAVLRQPSLSRPRYLAGQDWRACIVFGHSLSDRLVISRVSSQDRGVDASADVVVATAALEVGFDDPHVGAVVQHKAPRSMAGFLQRRGRGGRQRGMRPWTLVILSDYGRDRVAYQAYDTLFDPELPVRTLPLNSRYICRMQATYAFIDYLSTRLPFSLPGSVWSNLADFKYLSEPRRYELARQIRALLEGESATADFADYLTRALQLDSPEVAALLWEYPRPLMTTVLPTALRRLETRWRDETPRADEPLPEFIPSSLFSELSLPEVRINLQRAAHRNDDEQFMPFFSAIKEFAPGRVTRRFGIWHGAERDWISPPEEVLKGATCGDLELDACGEMFAAGLFQCEEDRRSVPVAVYKPVELKPSRPPQSIGDTSNSILHWNVQFAALGEGLCLDPPKESAGSTIFNRLTFFLHTHHMPVEVRRFAQSCEADLVLGRSRHRAEIHFVKNGMPAAVGAAFSADAVAFDFTVPSDLFALVNDNDRLARVIRTLRFTDSAWRGDTLTSVSNPFQREWLAQIQLSAISYEALRAGLSLEEAAHLVANGTAAMSRQDVLSAIFRSQVVKDEDQDIRLIGEDRLRQDLQNHLTDLTVTAQLDAMSGELWRPIDQEWNTWLKQVYEGTTGAALLRTISDLCPSIDPESLLVDLDRRSAEGDGEPESRAWISERGPGGNGQVELFMRTYAEDPRRFFSMFRAALEMSEFELIDHQLTRLLAALTTDATQHEFTNAAVVQLRSAADHRQLRAAVQQLRSSLGREGFSPFHAFMVSAMNRVFRPNSGPASDRYLASALSRWNSAEERLGIEIDLRIVSYWLSQSDEIDTIAEASGIAVGDDRTAWRMGAIYGLLWGRGRTVREASLRVFHPFGELPSVERLLVLQTMVGERTTVPVEEETWFERTADRLASGHMVTLTCSAAHRERLGQALNELICNPIETEYIRAFARMQAVRTGLRNIEADIELVEAVQ
jgi:hypothetical protein